MTLTKDNHTAILCPPQHEGGRGNPFTIGDKTPLSTVVFSCPSFFAYSILSTAFHTMAGLFGQALCLVAPIGGISTPFNPATNDVEIIGGGYSSQTIGIRS